MKTFSFFLARFLLTGCLCWLFSTSQGRADVTFYDGTFNNADWAETLYTNGNGGTSSATQIGSGGNPGSYYQVTTHVNNGTACGAGIYLRNAFTYSPKTQGSIYNLDYAVDLYAFNFYGEAEPVVSQNGMIYFGPEIYTTIAGWGTFMETNLMAADFVQLIAGTANGEIGTDSTSHPDFTTNGSPIVFGFIVPDNTLTTPYTTVGGVDNYTLTVHVAGRLNISSANNLIMLSWLASTNPVFNLQCTPALTPPAWSAVTNAPVLNGEFYFVTNHWTNQALFFRLIQNVTTTSDGMALIPAGSFTLGDTLDGESDAIPTNVYVSAFYMDTNLVSYGQWKPVYNYAIGQGYVFDSPGSGKADNQPVCSTVNWYDSVKWCNARSQQAGLTPVYYTDAGMTQIYTNGDVDALYPNWSANGYRLPTEAEWEKAARGGLSGQRFPWGDTISESQANYSGDTETYSYDLGPDGANTNFNSGYPYTSPVGYFAPNGYGLYDMAGNLFEWCWDWYATPPYPAGSPYLGGTDPRGPAANTGARVQRTGAWNNPANYQRCFNREAFYPNYGNGSFGFRCVRNF